MKNYAPNFDDIKYLDCDPYDGKHIVFTGGAIKVISGSKELAIMDLRDLMSMGNDCSNANKKTKTLPPNTEYSFKDTISGSAGEFSFVAIKVTYCSSIKPEDRYLRMTYLDGELPIKNLAILTGRTKPGIAHHGWILDSAVANALPITPSVDGLVIINHHDYAVELEILIME